MLKKILLALGILISVSMYAVPTLNVYDFEVKKDKEASYKTVTEDYVNKTMGTEQGVLGLFATTDERDKTISFVIEIYNDYLAFSNHTKNQASKDFKAVIPQIVEGNLNSTEIDVQIAKDTYKMKIKGNFVKECRTPGQFVNIRIGDGREHVLRRPISISEIDRGENLVTIIYRIVGEGTKFMANIKKGNEIDIMGPLGRGYDVLSLKKGQTALLVGGGIGVPPLYELAKQFNQRGIKTITILGFNSKDEVFYEDEFVQLGKTYIATADGSYGEKGFVTDVIKKYAVDYHKYFSCGPFAMLKALTQMDEEKMGYISLEERMACGVGACYACVCEKKDGTISRVCYDGPVYDTRELAL